MSSAETITRSPQQAPSWQIKLLYDGECPLCLREVHFLQQRDGGRGLVEFVDIADESYNPEDHSGIDYETAMGRIHGILPDGKIIKDIEVFRTVYEILGMGWIYAPTRLPILNILANQIYTIWANLRLKLTGRPSLATLVAQRQQRLDCPDDQKCRLER
ncbi:thiol-disulfide oxidoreductase DCC family protein [Coleofasciculus sp. G2-EDA-02]|uniref:thiol-disulfide oxidoreductase DCC family protein n=1 Tax=Coleofasciculus sp. G2-EDA-02 TaxID=3069529 RepID=UPI0032F67045